ncbi:TELO2-interacting protein 2 isoform X1 [Microcaecilia unicolor]|uniref:TELO2-interacting protein 2 isoform X1 n=1 Tax=Microcaecilia unicolor TaxID=1415580 RepID=A0A6P7XXZ9_9AMPH|nr:TELO2-interacting protein 2 isoform X1 [Microcaecilia unicolor]
MEGNTTGSATAISQILHLLSQPRGPELSGELVRTLLRDPKFGIAEAGTTILQLLHILGERGEDRLPGEDGERRNQAAGEVEKETRAPGERREPLEECREAAGQETGDVALREDKEDLGSLPPDSCRALLRCIAAPVYVFARAHHQKEVMGALLRALGCESEASLLQGPGGIFRAVMGVLKPDLSKDTWDKNPATKEVFSWTLQQVSRPWLSDHLDSVLAPSLLISDDYRTENKILGVSCLHHILLNVPAAELCQYNRAHVVYHALYHHLYTPEADLIQAVLLCLLDLLPVLEKQPVVTGECRQFNCCDDLLQLILTHMEMESRILLRRVYARNLTALVNRLGIKVAGHLKRLTRVIVQYLEVYDGPEEAARLAMLEVLQCTIQQAWPRMSCRLDVLLKSLLRLIYDVSTEHSLTPEPVKAALLKEATQCLLLLDRCCQRQVLLMGVYSSCTDSNVLECIERVQQDS